MRENITFGLKDFTIKLLSSFKKRLPTAVIKNGIVES